jgi:hypothetical protein
MGRKRNEKGAIERGWYQLRRVDTPIVKRRIMKELGWTSDGSFCNRMYGYTMPKIDEVEKINKIFLDYKIKDDWGFAKPEEEEVVNNK